MCVINMTPHPINVVDDNNNVVVTYPASGSLIRLKSSTVRCGSLPDGTPKSKTVFGEPEGLPARQEGTWLLVSQLVKTACSDRDDLLVPAEVVRDENGTIIGCRSLGE